MNPNSSDENRALDAFALPLERFGVRSRKVLRQLNITTIADFLSVSWDTVDCWQLGIGTREQLRQIYLSMSRNPEEWLRQCEGDEDWQLTTPPISVEWPADIMEAPLPTDSLSLRSRNVLWQNGLRTLGAFLNFDWERAVARQLGAKTRAELLQWRVEMGQTPEEMRDWMAQHQVRAVVSSFHTLPDESQIIQTETGQVHWPRLWIEIVRECLGSESRVYEVLKRRFSLDGSACYSLDKLGLKLDVSRERVRQIETAGLLSLRKLLAGQTLRGSKLQLHPRAFEEQLAFKQLLEEIGFPLAEDELWQLIQQRYVARPDENEKAFFRLLLELWDFAVFSPSPPDIPQKLGHIWLETAKDREFTGSILRSIAQNLREQVEPIALFDLQIAVNGALKAEKIDRHCDEVALRRLIALWPRAEEIAPDWFQTRWKFLPSNQSRAERILREWAATGTLRATISQLCQEVNHRHALAGRDDEASYSTMSNACAASPHIENIGKSGQWALVENAGETRPVHEIIKEALLKLNREATIEELNDYVGQRRETSPQTVACLMNQHSQFQRVGRGVYALRAWGMQDAAPVRRGEEYQREFDDLLMEIFLENNLEPIPHADIVNQLQAHLGWHISTVRQRIERSAWIETTSINGFHLMAHMRDKPETEAEKPERQTKMRRVQEAARALLKKSPQRQLAGATLSTLIAAQTNFVKPLIYSALAAMPDIERRGEVGAMIYLLKE